MYNRTTQVEVLGQQFIMDKETWQWNLKYSFAYSKNGDDGVNASIAGMFMVLSEGMPQKLLFRMCIEELASKLQGVVDFLKKDDPDLDFRVEPDPLLWA